MASRVNTKFVVGLGVFLLAAVAGVAYFGLQAMNAGGEQNVTKGDEAAAAGKYDQAAGFYGRAVNKDRGNAEWIRKWIAAMEKTTPATRQAYEDAYRSQYTLALHALCEADKKNPAPFKRYLDERYQLFLRSGGSLAQWEFLAKEYGELNKLYQGDQAGRDSFRRYRGLAYQGMLSTNSALAESMVTDAIADFEAALKADPADSEAVVGLASFRRVSAERLAKAGKQAEADKLNVEAHAVMEAFASANPAALRVRMALLSDEINEFLRSRKGDGTLLAAMQASRPTIAAIVESLNTLPPEQSDPLMALAIAPLAGVALPDGTKVVIDMLANVRKSHPDSPAFLLGWARSDVQRGQFDHAIELTKQVTTMPDKPMSLAGLTLFESRAIALRIQADVSFMRWEQEKDAAKREEWVTQIKAIRRDLAGRVGETAPAVLSIDGRMAVVANDITGARTLISAYNDQTRRTDEVMLMIQAQLHARLGQKGAARDTYGDVLKINRQNVRALRELGVLEADLRDFKSAAGHLALASAIAPENAELKELAKNAALLGGDNLDADPIVKAIFDAMVKANGLAGDVEGGIKILSDALKEHPGEVRLSMQLAQFLYAKKDVDGAKRVLDESIARNPTNTALPQLRASLDKSPLPLADLIKKIDESPATEVQKALSRWQTYARAVKRDASNKPLEDDANKANIAQAEKALQEAARLAPEDPLVLNTRFDAALINQDVAEIDRLIPILQRLDADKVGGQLYVGRALMYKNKPQEAIGVLRAIVSKDKLNLLAWRLLGEALLATGQPVQAADALKNAVAIKPDDTYSVNSYIRALVSVQSYDEALVLARKSEPSCSSDPEFIELLLSLEAVAPGGDKSKAIAARKRLAERQPTNLANKRTLASIFLNDSNFAEAKPIIDELRKGDPNSIAGVELEAAMLGKKGEVAAAVDLIQKFVAGLPSETQNDRRVELCINCARLLLQLGQPEAALKMLDDARPLQDPKFAAIDREIGDVCFNLGRMPLALTAYQRILDSGAEDPQATVRKRMLEACLKDRKFDEMQKMVDKLPAALQADPTVILLQAEAAAQQNDRQRALKLFDQAIAAEPKNTTGYFKRGDYRLSMNNYKDAETDFEQMIRIDPGNVIARQRLARIYTMTGRDDLSIQMLKSILTIEPYNEQMRLALIARYQEIGRRTDAAQACDEAVAQFPGSLQWLMKAVQCWGMAGNWVKAADHAKNVWSARKDADVAVAYVEALLNSNNLADAFNILRTPEVTAMMDKNLAIRMLWARTLGKQGQAGAAAKEIAASLRMVNTDSPLDASLFMAGVAGIYETPAKQIDALTKLEAGVPFQGFLATRVNELRLHQNETKAAAMAALEAITTSQADPRVKAAAWSILGKASYDSSQWEQARVRFVRGLELDPENIELNNNLAYLLTDKLGKSAEAIPYAVKAVSAAPLNSGFLDTLGSAQIGAKSYEEGNMTLTAALQAALNDSERVPVYIHLGRARLLQGDKLEAKRLAALARDLMTGQPNLRDAFDSDLKALDKDIDAK